MGVDPHSNQRCAKSADFVNHDSSIFYFQVSTAPGAESDLGEVEVGWGGRFKRGKAFRQPSLATLRTFLNFQLQSEDSAKKEIKEDDQCTVLYELDQGVAGKRKIGGKWSGQTQGFPVSKTPTISEAREAEPSTGLRPIIIDGSNVAMAHGKNKVFSAKGIKLVADHFKNNGHSNIVAFVPQFRKKSGQVVDRAMLQELEEEGGAESDEEIRELKRRFLSFNDNDYLNIYVYI